MSRTVQLNTRVDERTANAIAALAELTGRTKARIFHDAITDYVRREETALRELEEARASICAGEYYTLDEVTASMDAIIAQAEAKQSPTAQ